MGATWHLQHSDTVPQCFTILSQLFVYFFQVYGDDVLTKEEQIDLLFRAKRKCEGIIKAKHRIPGEQRNNVLGQR